jgi:hypothetical protein
VHVVGLGGVTPGLNPDSTANSHTPAHTPNHPAACCHRRHPHTPTTHTHTGYLGSIFLTLYAAIIMHSYLLSLLCSGLQVVALAYYLTSHYPGGTDSVRFMLRMFGSAASSCFSSCAGMLFSK